MMRKYENLIKEKMSKKRFLHSLSVCKESEKLAIKYGIDYEKAAIAGMLHDVTKEISNYEHIELIKKCGINLDKTEKSSPGLLHAVSGAAYVKTVLNISDDEIFNAIRYHTTGREKMSLLEKIIFVADCISEDRNFIGVEELNLMAYENLDAVVFEKLKYIIRKLVFLETEVANNTFLAYNEACSRNI